MLTAEIFGKEVIGSAGFDLGRVTDLQFDEKGWKVLALEVHLHKDVAEEHHLRHRFRKTHVLIDVDHVQGVGDRVILKGSKEDLLTLIASSPVMSSSKEDPTKGTSSDVVSTPDPEPTQSPS
jgi:sporulation protein YlmC with PRC-barrel domain